MCSGQGVITTVAGNGTMPSSGDGGPATSAGMNPWGVAVDGSGNIYIAELANNRVRKVTPAGVISTVAGCGTLTIDCILAGIGDGGPATAPNIFVFNVAVDGAGNLYIADDGANRVRKVNTAGILSTVAGGGPGSALGDGGPATSAVLNGPNGMAVDGAGNLYFADSLNHRIRKVNTAGVISTVAGTGTAGFSGDGGPATSAALNTPFDVKVDSAGNLYICDTDNYRVRKVNTAGIITTVAGNGQVGVSGDGGKATAGPVIPWYIALDGAGNLYLAEPGADRVRKVDGSGIITTVAGIADSFGFSGDGGPATKAQLNSPNGLTLDGSGNIYIADSGNHRIRRVSAPPPPPPSILTNGVVNGASFVSGIVPNSWITISGSNLAATTDTWDKFIVNGKLPTALDGVTVTIGGQPAYLYYIGPGQINLIAPNIATGPVQVTVTTPGGTSAALTVTSSQFGPAFFSWPGSQAVATRQNFDLAVKNGTFGGTTVPAKPGEVIILWGTGFGPTTPPAPTGVQVPSDQTYSTSALPSVTINNIPATVYGAALAPGYAGLYQVAIQVPASLADGDWPIVASIGGVKSVSGIVISVKQ